MGWNAHRLAGRVALYGRNDLSTWVRVEAIAGALVACLYVVVGEYTIGIAVAAATIFAVAWQTKPAGRRGVAGGQVRSSERISVVKLIALLLGVIAVLAFIVQGAFDHWSRGESGKVLVFALLALEGFMFLEARRTIDDLTNQSHGAEAEEIVGARLDALRDEGWYIDHNVDLERGGNLDHLAIWPHGAYAIETKATRYRSKDYSQAMHAMYRLREMAGVDWATAIVCVPGTEVTAKRDLWIVGRDALADWLRNARFQHRLIDLDAVVGRLEGESSSPVRQDGVRV